MIHYHLTQDKEYINKFKIKYVNRLTSLIEDLFEVSKANSGNIKLKFD